MLTQRRSWSLCELRDGVPWYWYSPQCGGVKAGYYRSSDGTGAGRPLRALDLFCGSGGATRGLQQAGFHVTGVDIVPQPHYVGHEFYQDDAMAWLHGEREPLASFDLVWVSPECQYYSELTPTKHRNNHPDSLPEVLSLLRAQPNVPWIAENVERARSHMHSPITLCGSMFGLNIWRHRCFELGNTDAFFLLPSCNHSGAPVLVSGRGMRQVNGVRWNGNTTAERVQVMECEWMTGGGVTQAIPPAYSRFLATQILAARG